MYRLISDAANLMRLQFRPADEYVYPLHDMLGALLVAAAVNTAMMAPLLSGQHGIMALMFCLQLVKWPVFSTVMDKLMGAVSGRRVWLWGYVLVSEVLVVPLLLLVYVPRLALLGDMWSMWGTVATIIGFARLCGARVWQVLLGYALSFCVLFVVAGLLWTLFVTLGVVDTAQMEQLMMRWQEMMNTVPPGNK
ncbi:hypothetical protein H9Q10_10485 [Eikenella sp. S3360]|uniref:Yip1 domain-containing protein n=1 Tax=Eikenella glucosivorans TaxID=2766967 RepID=A0ABS0NCQ2_9NEIS|nr:hypothetical protein [Eikenella glucosivorans]MBH5330090.1 hypothetical protein [Eikenella glucosivorans]